MPAQRYTQKLLRSGRALRTACYDPEALTAAHTITENNTPHRPGFLRQQLTPHKQSSHKNGSLATSVRTPTMRGIEGELKHGREIYIEECKGTEEAIFLPNNDTVTHDNIVTPTLRRSTAPSRETLQHKHKTTQGRPRYTDGVQMDCKKSKDGSGIHPFGGVTTELTSCTSSGKKIHVCALDRLP